MGKFSTHVNIVFVQNKTNYSCIAVFLDKYIFYTLQLSGIEVANLKLEQCIKNLLNLNVT